DDPWRRKRWQGGGAADARVLERRRRPRLQVPGGDWNYRPARCRAWQTWIPAALPLQEHRLRGVLRRADYAQCQALRPTRGARQFGDLSPIALHDGDVPVRPLLEGYRSRQDRLIHGGRGLRGVA